MANFQTSLVKHLSLELNCGTAEIAKALNSFGAPRGSSQKKSSQKSVKSQSDEKHTCERIPRGRSEPCGKKAKNEIEYTDGSKHWFCGTPKSACTKSVLGMIKRENQKKAAEDISIKTVKGSSNAGRKKKADKKTESFLKKKGVIREFHLQCKKINTKSNGTLHVDLKSRVLIDRETKKAYGILGKDDETILPLGKEGKDWAELHNIQFTQKLKEKELVSESDTDTDTDSDSDTDTSSDTDSEIDLGDM